MMLHHPFPLRCFEDIRNHVHEYMNQFEGEDLYIQNVTLPDHLLSTLNTELAEHDLPNAWNFLVFKRRNFQKNLQVHVDYSKDLNQKVSTSIVFPIHGCENTAMYWVAGEHKLSIMKAEFGTYAKLSWTQPPSYYDEVSITTVPMLCKVDVPHSAYNYSHETYRTIMSVRLQGNPAFEDVLLKIR